MLVKMLKRPIKRRPRSKTVGDGSGPAERSSLLTRAVVAGIIGALVLGGLILANGLIRRVVDFRVVADTEIFSAQLGASGAEDAVIMLRGVRICHGVRVSASPGVATGCGGYAHGLAVTDGEVRVPAGARLRLTRRGSDGAALLLTSPDGGATPQCPGGVSAFLARPRRAAPALPLCSPVLLRWPKRDGEAPRLVLRGINPRIGDSAGTSAGDAAPVLWSGKVEMRSRGLLSDIGQRLRGSDLDPLADPVPMGSLDLSFGEAVAACPSGAPCASRRGQDAPFVALVSAQSAGGLKINVRFVSSTAVIEDFGARAQLLSPTFFARVRNDPNVVVLYALLGLLVGIVLRADKLFFGKETEPES